MPAGKRVFDVKNKFLARALKKTFSPSSVFFFSLHQTAKEFQAFIKCMSYLFLSNVLYSAKIDWLIYDGGQI